MKIQLHDLKKRIFSLNDINGFTETAFEIFNYQYNNNQVYHKFAEYLGKKPSCVNTLNDIPFLPVELYKSHKILTGNQPVEKIFESSKTTGSEPGKHFISDLSLYEESFLKTFSLFYGKPQEYIITALLPSYLERENSSLVYMADRLIRETDSPLSGFYKDNIEDLIATINKAHEGSRKIMLLGVSFALLDLAETKSPDLSGLIVMETGGMKGRRKELTRQELHSILKKKLNIVSVHSEYGMTELLSQAYSKGDGMFYCPPWMKIMIRDSVDPLTIINEPGRSGGINVIDLANINSCSFIATGDLGRLRDDMGFEVIGRFDNSDVRGCNLMVE